MSLVLLLLACFHLAGGCTDDPDHDDDITDDDADDDADDEGDDACPEDRVEEAKAFLVAADGDAARSAFLAILRDHLTCSDAELGVVLADQLRFFAILDDLLYFLFDPFVEEKGSIDVGAIVHDYAGELLQPIVEEMLFHLDACGQDDSLRFELSRMPLRLLDLEFLVYAGEYDQSDILLQTAEFRMIHAALDTILSMEISFDLDVILDHIDDWAGMSIPNLLIDVLDTVLILFDDLEFLRLRDDGYWRLPRAGQTMGRAYQSLYDGVAELRGETQDAAHDVSGCGDRDGNGACDSDEFLHGLFYSLPSDLHWELQQVDLAMRDSYWDGTELDVEPGVPNPFTLDRYNPVLKYLGLPPLLPALPVDLGGFYANPRPDGARDTAQAVLTIARTILVLLFQTDLTEAAQNGPLDDAVAGEPTKASVPQGPPTVGLATAEDVAALPYLRPTARTKQFSSHDPTGGNQDGFLPPNHLYIDEHGEFVVFDQYGPGCIYRMQFTHTWTLIGNLRIYVDDMEVPVIEGPFWLLFFSVFEPFTKPLVRDLLTASGTSFSYLPIPFERRCRITVNVPPEYFGFTYVVYDADTPVTSYTGRENYEAIRSQWRSPGEDPKPDVPSISVSGNATLAPGEAVEIVRREEAGAIWQLHLAVDPFAQDAAENLRLSAWWDGEQEPSVDAPVPEFFGSYYVEETPKTLMMGADVGRYYSYFPMPFWSDAVIVVENRGASAVSAAWDVEITEDAYTRDAGYFRAVHRVENPVSAGRDYRIGMREGAAGKWVGLTHTMRGPRSGWYLEGDERFYVDGSASPAVHGTGTEDYYNGGWYFLMGTFTEPLCGNPSHRLFPDSSHHGTYRLHLADAVHYRTGVRLGIEHGGANEGNTEHYSSVAYYYEARGLGAFLTDSLDVGNTESEAAHGYEAAGSRRVDALTAYYEGEDDEIPLTDDGRVLDRQSRFTVAVDPDNLGVVLRRRYDQREPRQQARVFVDGVEIGAWYTPEHSRTLRWAEDDIVLPASTTTEKNKVEIVIRMEGDVPWTEFAYWALSIVPPEARR